jgi:RND family efflux transporter MFP subunit
MTDHPLVTFRRASAVIMAVLLVAAGAAAGYLFTRASRQSAAPPAAAADELAAPGSHSAGHGAPASPTAAVPAPGEPLRDVTVTLTQDSVERAGIKVAPVGTGRAADAMRIPGVIEPNAYKQVVVTPIVAGRITDVLVELGQPVRRGQTMARIFSPELAEAQTKFVSLRAELEAHEQELRRTERLVEIGAASRQALERIHAEHTARTAEVQSARSRLELLGMSGTATDSLVPGKRVEAAASVPAPLAGIVTERLANVGLNVDTATRLFTVVDLSAVWVVADVHEKDLSRVRAGSRATITTTAYPGRVLDGRVSYIDPQVSADTRTARVRVEVPNPGRELRLGMYAEVTVAGASTATVILIPKSAVQNVGDRQVVYLVTPGASGSFIEREVRLGQPTGDQVEVLSGAGPGDTVVTSGSFFIRAERERLGLRTHPESVVPPEASTSTAATRRPAVQTARVTVGDKAFEPSRLTLRAGQPARVTFVRTSDKTCATDVVFPALNLARALPLNQPVVIEFTPSRGELAFRCGMKMLRGTIVAE